MFMKPIYSNNAPKALGPYSPAIKLGDFVYLSGQVPIDPQTGNLVAGGIVEQTHQVLKNIEALLMEMGLETRHIVKTTVFIKDMNDFSAMNAVYDTYFKEPYPARSTVEVSRLPKDSLIEIECMVIDTLAYEAQMGGGCADGCDSCSGCGDDHGHDDGGCGCGDGGCGDNDGGCGCGC